jgi:hypothetical protein
LHNFTWIGNPRWPPLCFKFQKCYFFVCNFFFFLYPRSLKERGVYCFTSVLPYVQDIFRHIFLSNCWWQKSDIWSQASYRYTILWVAFLDLSDSYFLFADFVDFYTHWTYMLIFLSNYWWQESDIWSQASYRYAILWEAFLDLSDSYFLFADLVGFYTHWTYMHIFRHIFLIYYWWQRSDISSQASYRYPILWEAFFDPSDSYFLFAEERGYHRWALAHSSSCFSGIINNYMFQQVVPQLDTSSTGWRCRTQWERGSLELLFRSHRNHRQTSTGILIGWLNVWSTPLS